MRKIVMVTAWFLASSITVARADEMAPEKILKGIFELSGMLLRASAICDEKQKEYIQWSFKLQTLDDEIRAIGKGFPEMTGRWMTNGAGTMNDLVMQQGVKGACFIAYTKMINAAVEVMKVEDRQSKRK